MTETTTLAKSEVNNSSKKRVLILEDNECVAHGFSKMLEHMGYEVDTFPTGRETIQAYTLAIEENKPYCVVFVDKTVEGDIDGLETNESLLRLNPNIPRILTSCDPDLSDTIKEKFSLVTSKDFNFDKLKATLDYVLGG